MLGFNHVTMAMTAGVATLAWSGQATTPGQLGWVATVGGLGLLPDLDQRRTTAARTWGPPTETLAAAASVLSGGHRKGTHDLILGPLTFGLITYLALQTPVGACVVIALAIGLGLQGLALAKVAKVGPLVNLVVSWSCAWWLVVHGHADRFDALPFAVVIAVWTHLLGDALTRERLPVPVLWLLGNRHRIGLPLFVTGKKAELAIITPLLQAVLILLWLRHVGVHDLASAQAELRHLATQARALLP